MRKPRIVVPNTPHHIFNRGNNRRRLFSFPRDFHRMLGYMERARDAVGGIAINALTLMANHYHLIVVPESGEALRDFVKSFSQKYAVYRNRGQNGSGKLFEERYESRPLLNEAHLAAATAYVELNPVRAAVVDDPQDYLWSTCRLHLNRASQSRVRPSILAPSAWYLGLSHDPVTRAGLFREFLEQCRARDLKPQDIGSINAKEREAQKVYKKRVERPNRQRAC